MRTILLALACLALACSAFGQAPPPKLLDAPAYQLGTGTIFDQRTGVVYLPANMGVSYSLPGSCTSGQIQVDQAGVFFCGNAGWVQLAQLTGGIISTGQLPNIDTLPGQLALSQIPSTINANTTGNAATATALAAAPSGCASGQYATKISVNGTPTCAQVQWSQIAAPPAFALPSSLATVATSGSYTDLINKPALNFDANGAAAAAQAASLGKVANLSDLASVPTARTNLGLAVVASSGSYNDLTNKPTIPGSYTLPVATASTLGGVKQGTGVTIAGDGTISAASAYTLPPASGTTLGGVIVGAHLAANGAGLLSVNGSDFDAAGAATTAQASSLQKSANLSDVASVATAKTNLGLAVVASSGSYNDLSNKPSLNFDASGAAAAAQAASLQKTANLSDVGNAATARTNLGLATVAHSGAYADLTGAPALATVATTGSYTDLINKPTIPGAYTLPQASASVLGGVKIGANISEGGDGTISVAAPYTLPAATTTTLGGVIVGSHLDVASGTLSVHAADFDASGAAATAQTASLQKSANLSDVASTSIARTNLGLATVAHTGAYSDLTGTPTLSFDALGAAAAAQAASLQKSANLGDVASAVSARSNLGISTVGHSGSYLDLLNIPSFATVATTGSYNDLSNKPTIPGAYTLPAATTTTLGGVIVGSHLDVASGTLSVHAADFDASGAAATAQTASLQKSANLSDVASAATSRTNLGLATVAATGSYTDLTNKPSIPSAYTLPAATTTTLGGVIIGSHLDVTSGTVSVHAADFDPAGAATTAVAGALLKANNLSDLASAATARSNLGLATVANTGSYTDLINKPTIPAAYTLPIASGVTLGGVKIGSNVTVGGDGTISVAAPYTLPAATTSTLGGVIVGSHLDVSSGTISVHAADFDPAGAASSAAAGSLLKANNLSDLANTATARTNLGLAAVASTGSYNDLSSKPTIPTNDNQLTNGAGYAVASSLATVATSGSYLDLINKPVLALVATSGSYLDLSNRPTGLPPSGPAGGDLAANSGGAASNYPNPLVTGINGTNLKGLGAGVLAQSNLGVPHLAGTSDIETALGFTPLSTIPVATTTVLGGVKQGSGVTIAGDGTLSVAGYTLPVATPTVLGGIKCGTNITCAGDGTASVAAAYVLPPATASTLGGVKQGSNVTIASDGTLSVAAPYVLPAATSSTLGGVIVGTGLTVTAGTEAVTYGKVANTSLQGSLWGTPLGVAELDANGKIPTAELPTQTVVYLSQYLGTAGDAVVAPGSTTYGTDQAAAINGILAGGNIHLIVDGQYSLSTALKVYSNTKIEVLPGDGFIMRSGVNSGMIMNGDLESPTAASSTGGYLVSNITDQNIEISGGIWNGNATNANSGTYHNGPQSPYTTIFYGFEFMGVSNLSIHDLEAYDLPYENIFMTNVSDVHVTNIYDHMPDPVNIPALRDGVHFIGPATNLWVENCHFHLADDSIAFNANDGWQPGPLGNGYPRWGPITHAWAENNYFDNTLAGVRVDSSSEFVDDIHIDNNGGSVYERAVSINNFTPSFGSGNFGYVSINGLNVSSIGTSPYTPTGLIYVTGNMDSLVVNNVNFPNPTVQNWPIIYQDAGTINQLTVSNWQVHDTTTALTPMISTNGSVSNMFASNMEIYCGACRLLGGTTPPANVNITGKYGDVDNIDFPASGYDSPGDHPGTCFSILGGTLDLECTSATSMITIINQDPTNYNTMKFGGLNSGVYFAVGTANASVTGGLANKMFWNANGNNVETMDAFGVHTILGPPTGGAWLQLASPNSAGFNVLDFLGDTAAGETDFQIGTGNPTISTTSLQNKMYFRAGSNTTLTMDNGGLFTFLGNTGVNLGHAQFEMRSGSGVGDWNFISTDSDDGGDFELLNKTGSQFAPFWVSPAAPTTSLVLGDAGPQLKADTSGTACNSGREGSLTYSLGSGTSNGAFKVCENQSSTFNWVTLGIGGSGGTGGSSGFGPDMPDLATFEEAVHNAANQVVNIVLLTDSIGVCYQGSTGVSCGPAGPTSAGNRYTDKLRAYFAAAGLNHGTGIVPVQISVGGTVVNGAYWSVSGSWSQSSLIGPTQTTSGQSGSGLMQMASGTTASFSAGGAFDHLNVYCAESSSSNGITVTIDGSGAGTACSSTSGSPIAHVDTFSTSGLSTHTVVLTATGSNSYLFGAEGTIGSTGVSLHLIGYAGAAAEMYGTNTSSQLAFTDLIPGGTQLAVVTVGTNEPVSGESVSTYTTSMNNIVTHEQGLSTSPSVLIWNEPPNTNSSTPPLSSYWNAAQSVAAANGAAYLAVGDRWGTFSQANAQSLFVSDGLHPNDKGEADMAAQLQMAILGFNQYSGGGGGGGSFSGGAVNYLTVNGSTQFPQLQIVGTSGFVSGVGGAEFKSSDGLGDYSFYAYGSTWPDFQLVNMTTSDAIFSADKTGDITIGSHFGSHGGVPTFSAGSAAGSSPSISVFGHDTAGFSSVSTGSSGVGTGTLVTITFNQQWYDIQGQVTSKPYCVVGAGNPAAAATQPYITNLTTTSMDIAASIAPGTSSSLFYQWACSN